MARDSTISTVIKDVPEAAEAVAHFIHAVLAVQIVP